MKAGLPPVPGPGAVGRARFLEAVERRGRALHRAAERIVAAGVAGHSGEAAAWLAGWCAGHGQPERAKAILARLREAHRDDPSFWRDQHHALGPVRASMKAPPDSSARTLDGATIRLSALRGRVVTVDFRSTWCGPCVTKLPALTALYRDDHVKGLEIIGISADTPGQGRTGTALADWCRARGMDWPQVCNGLGWDGAVITSYAVRSLPATFVYDRSGTLVATGLRGADLSRLVRSLL